MANQTIKGKRKARKLALQAIYQHLMADEDPFEIEAQFHAGNDMTKVDDEYFHRLLHGVVRHKQDIEDAVQPFLDRAMDGLNPVELAAIRLGAFELQYCPELPYRVILDEAVVLSKTFGSQDGHRYVNGVLNNLARKVRTLEIEGKHG